MKAWPLVAANTHLYPGARLRVALPDSVTDRPTWRGGDALLLEFSDGVVVAGTLGQTHADEVEIALHAYATASGTAVAAKNWRLRWLPAHDAASPLGLQVAARVS